MIEGFGSGDRTPFKLSILIVSVASSGGMVGGLIEFALPIEGGADGLMAGAGLVLSVPDVCGGGAILGKSSTLVPKVTSEVSEFQLIVVIKFL